MKKLCFAFLTALLVIAACICAAEGIIQIPSSVAIIEDGAFASVRSDAAFIGKNVISIGKEIFDETVSVIYGYSNTEAEKYAQRSGKTFYALDDLYLQEEAILNVGDTTVLKTNISSDDPRFRNLRWECSDSSVATFKNGKIKAVKQGQCDISAYTENLLLARCRVIIQIPVKTVKLNAASVQINLYECYELVATLLPGEADDQTLSWASSNEDVATVDENGVVTTLKAGSCTVTATAASGASGSCKLTVKETKMTSFVFNDLFITLHVGDIRELSISASPAIAQNKRLNYSSSAPDVAYVDENGVLHALAIGNTVITGVSQVNSGVSNTCKVFVISENALPFEGVVIGINPGHQKRGINTLYPISPGSSTMKVGCKVGTQGLNTKTPEYVVALDVSLMLRDMLVKNGATVVMTRTDNDAYLTNIQRADILNKASVDAAIQVHCNGGGASQYGMSSYYRTSGSWVEEGAWMANCLLKHMLKTTGAKDAGVHVCNTYMSLNYSFTPACLVEMGYLTNAKEELLLINPEYQRKLAQGMYDGLLEYFGR